MDYVIVRLLAKYLALPVALGVIVWIIASAIRGLSKVEGGELKNKIVFYVVVVLPLLIFFGYVIFELINFI